MPESVDAATIQVADNLIKGDKEAHREEHFLWWKTKESHFFESSEIEKIVKEGDMGFIARGGECVVVAPKDHTDSDTNLRNDVVVAIDYQDIESSQKAKELFYTHRILSTLFPHNFPKFFTSYGASPKAEMSGTIRQRINEAKNIRDGDIKYPFTKVDEAINEMGGMPVQIDIWSSKNFMVGTDGGEYYVDKARLTEDPVWETANILSYMEKNNYSATDQRIVVRSIARLDDMTNGQGHDNINI